MSAMARESRAVSSALKYIGTAMADTVPTISTLIMSSTRLNPASRAPTRRRAPRSPEPVAVIRTPAPTRQPQHGQFSM